MTALMCLTMAIYFEARSEPLPGQYAVAEVIMNRAASDRFPDTPCSVIKQDKGPKDYDCQFSFWCDGEPETFDEVLAHEKARLVAADVLEGGTNYANGALFYHTVDVDPRWSSLMQEVAAHGAHTFLTDEVILADI